MFVWRAASSGSGCFWRVRLILVGLPLFALSTAYAQSTNVVLQFSPAQTKINFTLGDILHTVHGSFGLKRGSVEYDLTSASVGGELVADATSAQSGNRTRDRK